MATAAKDEKAIFALAEMAISNPAQFEIMSSLVDSALIEKVEGRIVELAILKQKSDLTPAFVDKEKRPEEFDALVDEFLFCMNKGAELAELLFVSKTSNMVGNNSGQKRERKIRLFTKQGDLEFKVFKKIK